MMEQFGLNVIKEFLTMSDSHKGNDALVFTGFMPVMDSSHKHISWIKPGIKNVSEIINNTKSGGIICDENTFSYYKGSEEDKLFIITKNPQLLFAKLMIHINTKDKTGKTFIHPTSILHPECKVGENVQIGAFCIIGKCSIGNNTVVNDNVKIYDEVMIGKNCVIREFCSMGGEGFGIVKDEKGNNLHIPHTGKVIIEDNVIIFPFSNIDRGTLGNTIVEEFTAIDHYCHIGHNVRVGKNSILTAGVVLAGGCKIGSNCYLGVKTIVKQKIIIGADVTTGMGSVVTADIPDGETWLGNPASEISSFLKFRKFIKKNSE